MSEAIKDESLSAFARRLSDEGAMIHAASWQQITGTLQMCADEIDTQAARIAELESRVHTCGPTCSKAGCINRRVTAERDTLRAEVERLRVDAERYEWLRAAHWSSAPLCCVLEPKANVRLGATCPSGDQLDTAIDNARKATP